MPVGTLGLRGSRSATSGLGPRGISGHQEAAEKPCQPKPASKQAKTSGRAMGGPRQCRNPGGISLQGKVATSDSSQQGRAHGARLSWQIFRRKTETHALVLIRAFSPACERGQHGASPWEPPGSPLSLGKAGRAVPRGARPRSQPSPALLPLLPATAGAWTSLAFN